MADDNPPVLNASPVGQQVGTGVRDVALVLAAVPTMLALLGRHDFLGLVRWLSSVDGLPTLGVIVTAAIFIWRQLIARWNVQTNVKLAKAPEVTIIGEKPVA